MNWKASDSHDLLAALAQAADGTSPFGDMLRAVAEDYPRRPVAAALRSLANQVDQGTPLSEAVHKTQGIPATLAGVINAACRTGRVELTLTEWLEQQWRLRELRRALLNATLYPLVLMSLSLLTAAMVPIYFGPIFSQLYEEYSLTISNQTRWVIDLADILLYGLASVAFLAVLFEIVRRVTSRATWRGCIARIPIVGRFSYWHGCAEFFRLLAILVDNQIRMPEALALAAAGAEHADVDAIAKQFLAGVDCGQTPSSVLLRTRCAPTSILPLLEWGERSQATAESFRAIADGFETRIQQRATWIQSLLPPFALIFVLTSTLGSISALLAPLVELITRLS